MRAGWLIGATALLALAWALPWARWLGAEFAAHMLRHMTLVALAAPLLVLGLPGLARHAPGPMIAAVVEFAVVWGWHLPGAHRAAAMHPGFFLAEQASFLAAGWLVWAGCLRGAPLLGAGGMLLTSMHMTLLGALLILAPRDLYAHGPLADLAGQQLGGMLMLGIGTPVYLLAGLALTARALTDREAAA